MKVTLNEWDEFLLRHPEAHFLQSGSWGELKSRFGWKVTRIVNGNSGAQLLFRPLPFGYSIAYLAKGPVGEAAPIVREINECCNANKAVFLKIEPNQFAGEEKEPLFSMVNLRPARPIQPYRTVIVPLDGSEEDILSHMKQKTRYNIRLAEKKEVLVKISADVAEFHKMALVTAKRDTFGVHTLAYYQAIYDLFHATGNCELLIASYQDQPLAALFVLIQGGIGYYLYGASYDTERNRMPTYLIQWEAMKWSRQKGCLNYDMWGIPDLEEEELEASFQKKDSHEGLWGVYRFKRGFGGDICRSVGAFDKVYHKGLYRIYEAYFKIRAGQDE